MAIAAATSGPGRSALRKPPGLLCDDGQENTLAPLKTERHLAVRFKRNDANGGFRRAERPRHPADSLGRLCHPSRDSSYCDLFLSDAAKDRNASPVTR
jgi:hypothetical protein